MSARPSVLCLVLLGCSGKESAPVEGAEHTVAIELVAERGPSCADPEARSGEPFVLAELGADWEAQAHPDEAESKLAGGGLTILDLDGDGLLDVYLPQDGPDQLYLQAADGTLVDRSETHLPRASLGGGTVAAIGGDPDEDGDTDLVVVVVGGPNLYLENTGEGRFRDSSEAVGLPVHDHDTTGAAWGDLDGDGDLDLLLSQSMRCQDGDTAAPPDPPPVLLLWEDGRFEDATARLRPEPLVRMLTRVAPVFDADDDGDQDAYLIGDHQYGHECLEPNTLMLQEGDAFVAPDTFTGIEVEMAGMGIAIGELNGDGRPDLVLSDDDTLKLYESVGPLEWADSYQLRVGELGHDDRVSSWGLELQDLDHDGDDDLFVGFGPVPGVPLDGETPDTGGAVDVPDQPDALYVQQADGSFVDSAEAWGISGWTSTRAVLAMDWNEDGWLDLARREIGGPAELYLARCGTGRWLMVELEQPPPNGDAIGAKVEVMADHRTWTEWTFAGGQSLYASRATTVHVGLGAVDAVDLRITWPDGKVSLAQGIEADQRLHIRRLE